MDKKVDAWARKLAARAMATMPKNKSFQPGVSQIPVTGKIFGEDEIHAATLASAEFWLTAGHFSVSFEKLLAERVGMRHCLMVNSGSSANLLAISALTSKKLGERALLPGDEVITVCNSFYATAGAIVAVGARPIFVDCDSRYQINVDKIKQVITKKTKAIMPVHWGGASPEIDKILFTFYILIICINKEIKRW